MKTTVKIPKLITVLGFALEIEAQPKTGDPVLIKLKRGKYFLCANPKSNKLYILPSKRNPKAPGAAGKKSKQYKQAGALYERFTDWTIDDVFTIDIPNSIFKNYGRALTIVYESDKWGGKDIDYIHTFKQPPILHLAGTQKKPKMIALTGGKIKVQPRGIVG